MAIRDRSAGVLALLVVATSCGRLPGTPPVTARIWLVAAPAGPALANSSAGPFARFAGALLVLDSISLRPVPVLPSPTVDSPVVNGRDPNVSRIATITTYQGSRYHAESIRALTDDSQVLARVAGAVASGAAVTGNGLFIDFQGATPDDLQRLVDITRAIADSANARGMSPIGIVVPPGDTVSYPTSVLARVAGMIVVRLYGEHRAGTAPGPPASSDWVSRQLGMRAIDAGVNRLVAELPLFGLRWDQGRARFITFDEARALVASESGSFRRDPATDYLTASGRGGWTVWVPDARTIETLIAAVRRSGVQRVALSGPGGADPEIWQRLPAAIRR